MNISMSNWKQFKVDLPLDKRGDWEIKKKTCSKGESDLMRLSAMMNGHRRYCRPGTYTLLAHKGSVIMSDTRDEILDHYEPIKAASMLGGHCLITGLGLGMVASAMLKMENVERVTVIELDPDVISLTKPTLKERFGERFHVVHANALEYKFPKGMKFSVVWHDIWPSICADNLTEMGKLHRKYAQRSQWQGSWCHAECKRLRRESRSRSYGWW